MNPRCTVLMPVRNGMPYVMESLRSLLAQTENDLKIVVIDDGSTDGTTDYLASITDERVTTVRTSGTGLVAALNLGLSLVSTTYVARMDADDIAHPDRILSQLRFMEDHPSHVLVGSRLRYISGDGQRATWPVNVPTEDADIRRGLKNGESVVFHGTILCRTEAVRNVGGYREGSFPAEDYDLFFRLAEIGKLANLPEVLLEVRVTATSVTGLRFHESLDRLYRLADESSGRTRNAPLRAVRALDRLSRQYYRRGIAAYLNTGKVSGMAWIFLAGCVNPQRALTTILRRFKQ